jgi:rubrerythrin
MFLFSPDSSPEEALITGFGLEMGLRDFYLQMESQMDTTEAKKLFARLAGIEVLHQQQLLDLYRQLTGKSISVEDFESTIVEPAMEGGLTTDQYLERYSVDTQSELEVLSLAMAIEVQALDLYLRAAESSQSEQTREVLLKIAAEERGHISLLAGYIDT